MAAMRADTARHLAEEQCAEERLNSAADCIARRGGPRAPIITPSREKKQKRPRR